ncbi:MAG TPA: hypothetical protein VFR05_04805 [Terriglobia bacterium]|nr:hypothetical protein [Terriglobia bacterium]
MHEQNTKQPLGTVVAGLLLIPALLVTLTVKFIVEESRTASERASRHAIIQAIDRFKAEKKTCPRSLEELFENGYLRQMPRTPPKPGNATLDGCDQPQDIPVIRKREPLEL